MRRRAALYYAISRSLPSQLLARTTNNMACCGGDVAATLSTVLLTASTGRRRRSRRLEVLFLCSVGIAQALFGTILLYLRRKSAGAPTAPALLWTDLNQVKGQLEPTVMSLAFVFLLWDTHQSGPGAGPQLVARRSCEGRRDLGGALRLLLNVASTRSCSASADGRRAGRPFAVDLMMGFGLLSVVVAAFLLSRQREIQRMFAYSSIEHMGS